jgi:GT2 family glycosyltransferase
MFQCEPMLRDAPSDFFNSGNGFLHLTAAPPKGLADEPPKTNSTAVIISTRGRPTIVNALVGQLAEQSKPPEHIFVVGSKPDDITGLDCNQDGLTVRVGRVGSSLQRNDGLALAGSRFSYIAFFDDDFVPSRFWLERMQDVFRSRPDAVGLTGHVLADGTTTAGIPLVEARAMVNAHDATVARSEVVHAKVGYGSNMGCNMAFRYSTLRHIHFDERLPLYAWMEDADFRGQAQKYGNVIRADAMTGVHLGHKQGRGRGVTLGYSQIANAIYLAAKGTVPFSHLVPLVTRNLLSNTVRSLRPEPFVDRRGRLLGNLIAVGDLLRGRIAPERILEL